MPILDVDKARTVLFVKRSLVRLCRHRQPLFFKDNTMMLLGDAKKMTEDIVKSLAPAAS
jgi:NAD(P) transhydrogenase subunit beta